MTAERTDLTAPDLTGEDLLAAETAAADARRASAAGVDQGEVGRAVAEHNTVDTSAAPTIDVTRAGVRTLLIAWDALGAVHGHGYYEAQVDDDPAFGSPDDFYKGAATFAVFSGLTTGTLYYARVRAVDASGTTGPWSTATGSQTTDEVDTPDVADDAVTTVKIADLAVTSAKIQSLTAAKITAGTISGEAITIAGGASGLIQSDNYVADTSGWLIDGAGDAEFNSITVRGTVETTATDGTNIYRTTIGATDGSMRFEVDTGGGYADSGFLVPFDDANFGVGLSIQAQGTPIFRYDAPFAGDYSRADMAVNGAQLTWVASAGGGSGSSASLKIGDGSEIDSNPAAVGWAELMATSLIGSYQHRVMIDDSGIELDAEDGGRVLVKGVVRAGDGSAAGPAYSFASQSGIGMWYAGSGAVGIETSGGMFTFRGDGAFINPDHPTTTTAAFAADLTAAGVLRRVTSSLRYKDDVREEPLLGQTPRWVSWQDKAEPDGPRGHGVIAEEIHDLGLTWAVQYDEQGRPDGVAYDRLALAVALTALRRTEGRAWTST